MLMIRLGSVGKLDKSASSGTWNKTQKCGRFYYQLRVAALFRMRSIFDWHCPNRRSQVPQLLVMTVIAPL
jgi:hypothetical protein